MSHPGRRSIVLLGAVAVASTLTACGTSSGGAGASDSKAPSEPLQIRAVKNETQGTCPSHSTTMVEDHGFCLQLGKPAMTVRSVKSAEVQSGPQWSVIVTLRADDAQRLESLTRTVSKRSGAANRVAMLVGEGSDQRLLSAPTVMEPMTGGSMQLSGGLTKESAEQLVHDLGH